MLIIVIGIINWNLKTPYAKHAKLFMVFIKHNNLLILFSFYNLYSIFIQVKKQTVSYFNIFDGYFW